MNKFADYSVPMTPSWSEIYFCGEVCIPPHTLRNAEKHQAVTPMNRLNIKFTTPEELACSGPYRGGALDLHGDDSQVVHLRPQHTVG